MYRDKGFWKNFRKNTPGVIGLCGVGLILLMGLCAPLIAPFPKGYTTDILLGPSAAHLFGTDSLGLDIFAQIVWGARTSLFVSLVAVAIATVVGIPLGLLSGYVQGRLGGFIDAVIEIFLTLPVLPLMIIVAAIMGSSVTNVAIVIGVFAWPSLARVARNATLKVSEMQYIEAAKCLNLSFPRILFKHILVNIIGPVMVNLTLVMATSVLSESGLSFLGLGDANAWSWGRILKKAWDESAVIDIPNPWWWWFIPSLFIVIYVVCFNLLGNAINETLSPKTE